MKIQKIYPIQKPLIFKKAKKEKQKQKTVSFENLPFSAYNFLCSIRPKSKPKKEDKLKNYISSSTMLQMYQEETKDPKYYTDPFEKEKIDALSGATYQDALEIEDACNKVKSRLSEIKLEEKLPNMLKTLIDLRFYDKEAFDYALESDYLLREFFAKERGNYFCVKNLTKASLIEIEKGKSSDFVVAYVNNSDSFNKYTHCTNQLDNFLSANETQGEMIVKRAERHTGVFDEIPLDDRLSSIIRFQNASKKDKTAKATFSTYTKSYFEAGRSRETTIYSYITQKESLTLADAMLLMPYLDDDIKEEVLDKIKGAKFYDNRFKSTTLSDRFINIWLATNENKQAQIENTITLEKGTKGRYVSVPFLFGEQTGNGQYEFIINRGKKEFTVEDVWYDSCENLFHIQTFMKSKK